MGKIKISISILSVVLLLLSSCGGADTSQKSKRDMRQAARERVTNHNGSEVYYSLPSPLEIAYIIQTTGVDYNLEILHKTELGVRYSTNKAAAINLGIYGADLSYSIYFNQQQIALKYLDCIKELASTLEVSDSLMERKLRDMEENIQNKEMLKKIVSQTFLHSDALLKENSKKPTATMIALGMWVESLYISAQLSNGDALSNPELTKAIVEQGLVFDDLLNMLVSVDYNNDITFVIDELQKVKNCYASIKTELGNTFNCADGSKINAKSFENLFASVTDLRNNFTQLF